MARFVAYTEDGKVLRTGSCPDGQELLQIYDPAETLYIGPFPGEPFYMQDGAPVLMPPRPSEVHTFDYAAKQWTDPRTLAQIKAAQWAAIKAERSAREFGGFTWDGSAFDSDAISQSRIQGAAQLAQLAIAGAQPFSIDWTLADNSTRTLNATEMISVGIAMGAHIETQHGIARTLRQQINAATTTEQVEAVAWPAL
jgi:hypothetical protein